MKKLIGMVDYVEETHKLGKSLVDYVSIVIDYAVFLKQKPELWMFVACDEDGNVLEEPKFNTENEYDDQSRCLFITELEKYQQAQERVIFYGCVYDDEMEVVRSQDGESMFYVPQSHRYTIEDLVKYNPQLTPTAQKQINE